MAANLNDFLSGFTPVPISTPEEYDGWQYRWKFIVFRPACNLFQLCRMTESKFLSQLTVLKTEGYLLGALLLYCLFASWGSFTNSKKTKDWYVFAETFRRLLLILSLTQARTIPSSIRATIL
jgi:hypothetical protein